MNTSTEVLQSKVQHKLGRCMIRLQEYERQLKAMLVGMSAEGQPAALQVAHSQRASSIHRKSLGILVGLLTADHLISEAQEVQAHESRVSASDDSSDDPFVSMKFRIVLPSGHYSRVKEGLAGLIRMRNDLVHHLLERFDLSAEDGCAAACDHLDSCHDEVERQLTVLQDCAEGITHLAGLVSSVLKSQTFEEMFLHVTESACCKVPSMDGVVEYLKMAEAEFTVDGWTCLESAIRHVTGASPGEAPCKYGCRTWRQLLARSEQFEVRVDKGNDTKRGKTWYRSRTEAPQINRAPIWCPTTPLNIVVI